MNLKSNRCRVFSCFSEILAHRPGCCHPLRIDNLCLREPVCEPSPPPALRDALSPHLIEPPKARMDPPLEQFGLYQTGFDAPDNSA
jgi:hypothetical protein